MRTRISPPTHRTAVDVCTSFVHGEQLQQHHYVLVHTTYRTVNKALSVTHDELDDLIADLQQARDFLRANRVQTTRGVCPVCNHPAHQGRCNHPLTEDIRDDVGLGGVPPSGKTVTLVTDMCRCGPID
jgi:hypothetical protein